MDSMQDSNLLNIYGKLIPSKVALKGKKYIVYYFSASWCDPCQFLLPKLKLIHEETQKRKIPLEIVYISLDSDADTMLNYFKKKHGDWFAIPFGDSAIEELRLRFGVSHIPYIIVIRNDGTVITHNGKKEVDDLGVNVLVTWID